MRMLVTVLFVGLCLGGLAVAQGSPPPDQASGQNQSTPQSDQEKSRDRSREAGESSSRDTRIDLSPPKDDAKNHPGAASDVAGDTDDVGELHPWNPYRAVKDDEVGDFYLKQGDYKGAVARYEDALLYKNNDAVANFRLGQCFEKLGQPDEAVAHYQAYLKILPQGPYAKQAKKALEKLGAAQKQTSEKTTSKP